MSTLLTSPFVPARSASSASSTSCTSSASRASRAFAAPRAPFAGVAPLGRLAAAATVAALLALAAADAAARSPAARAEFQQRQPCPANGRKRGACPGYQVDHRVPLKCGGADAPHNMQWLTVARHKAKTAREAKACRKRRGR